MRITNRFTPLADAESRTRGDELVAWLRRFGERRINSRIIDERRCPPPHVVLELSRQGLLGMQVEPRFGGIALRAREVGRILEQAAAIDLGLGTYLLVCLFPGVRPITAFGSDALKERVLPDLAAGRMLAGYAQTERGAGTHFASLEATAVRRPEGGWRLNGDKWWIGNATWSGVLTAMAQDIDAEDRRHGLVALAVRTEQEGVQFGGELETMGMKGVVQSEISFRDVDVEPDHLLGGPDAGLDVGVDSMSWSRYAIAATCVGSMKRCAQLMLRFAGRRSIATGRLIDHPLTSVALTEAVNRVRTSEALLYRCAESVDSGGGAPVEVFAACKVVGSEFLWSTVDRTMQLLGSRGYDEESLVPQMLRDARVTRIFEGPTEPLLAFLGSQAINARSDLREYLCDDLGAEELWERLQEAVTQVRARTLSHGGPLPRAWQLDGLGRAACFALLAAATGERLDRSPSPDLEGACDWALGRLDAEVDRIANGCDAERALLDPGLAEKSIHAFSDDIGDVQQSLPGARLGLDPTLHRDAD